MFEMLGNWSYGDYFKKEAISWAWELLTASTNCPPSGCTPPSSRVPRRTACPSTRRPRLLGAVLPADHIIRGNKHDNFWEMGETGPCGPCSEIHFDLRDEAEIPAKPGREMVNAGHPAGDRDLEPRLHAVQPQGQRLARTASGAQRRHGHGLRAPLHDPPGQEVELRYRRLPADTIGRIAALSGKNYGEDEKCRRGHARDGRPPARHRLLDRRRPAAVERQGGYVIRRILRRAVRYGYTYLGFTEPTLCKLVAGLVEQMGGQFPS